MQTLDNRSKNILSSVKATVAQLESWDLDQARLLRQRLAANASYPGGFSDRLDLTRHRLAQNSTVASPGERGLTLEPYCHFCDSATHDTKNCISQKRHNPQEIDTEDPALGIHRAIVHRLYLHACDLYHRLYPGFYPEPSEEKFHSSKENYRVPPSIPNYLALAITQAGQELQEIPGFEPSRARLEPHHPVISTVVGLYYSKSFPISYVEFCRKVSEESEIKSEE